MTVASVLVPSLVLYRRVTVGIVADKFASVGQISACFATLKVCNGPRMLPLAHLFQPRCTMSRNVDRQITAARLCVSYGAP